MRQQRDFVATKGRDAQKMFRLTEADAMKTEWWATRLFLALARRGVEFPDNAQPSLQAVAALGIQAIAKLDPLDAKPLLDEMFECVQVVPDPVKNPLYQRALADGDIEEIGTVLDIRMEVIALHANFSIADFLSNLNSGAKEGTPNTGTSPPQSAQPSRPARQPSRNARPSTP